MNWPRISISLLTIRKVTDISLFWRMSSILMLGSVRSICKRFVATWSFLKSEENKTHLGSGIRKVARLCGYACESSGFRDVSNVYHSLDTDIRMVSRRCGFSYEFAACTEPEVVDKQFKITIVRMQDLPKYIYLERFLPSWASLPKADEIPPSFFFEMLLVDMFNEITYLMVNVRAAAPLTRELLLCFERKIVLTMAWTRLEFRSHLLRDGNRRIHARLLIHWREKLFKLPIKFLRQHIQDVFIEYFVKCLSKKRHETKMFENKIPCIIKI